MWSLGVCFGALLVAFSTSGAKAQQKGPPASTFFLDQTATQFSVALANDSSDVYVYFASPAYSWVAVGFGESMRDSLMLVMYANGEGNNVTVSPRFATGHSEPEYSANIKLEILNGTGIQDEMYVLQAVCRSCRVWPGGFIDEASTASPMIFAFGPGTEKQSDDLSAPLRRHVRYGQFTMDMVAATSSNATVPQPNAQLKNATIKNLVKDRDSKDLAHAILGCIALFVLWPLNLIFAAFFRNIRIHVGASITILIFLVISYALGIATSPQYHRSKTYTSPHQLLAFLSLLPTLPMALLPLRPLATLKPWLPRLHTPLTTLTFLLLVLTGALGLPLATTPTPLLLAYTAIALLVAALCTTLLLCVRRRGSAFARATTRRRLGEDDAHDLGRAQWGVRKKLSASASESEVSWEGAPHARSPSGNSFVLGRGTMPGPQYLMNMHPGVPVYVNGQK